jgi:hypothetical protein
MAFSEQNVTEVVKNLKEVVFSLDRAISNSEILVRGLKNEVFRSSNLKNFAEFYQFFVKIKSRTLKWASRKSCFLRNHVLRC